MTRRIAVPVVVLLACLVADHAEAAPDYVRQESPHPGSATELEVAIERTFEKEKLSDRFLLTGLKEALADSAPFFRDTRLSLAFRTYAFDRRNSSSDRREAWAAGGRLRYSSGWWRNLSIRAAYYNSTEITADGGDTGLLRPGQENISVVGEANLRFRITDTPIEGSEIRLYRQTFNLPYVNRHDIRMLPAAHEGYVIGRKDSSLDFVLGHLTKFKDYDSDRFLHMSEAAGAEGSDEGLSVAGVRFDLLDNLKIGAFDHYGWDTFNTFYVESTYSTSLDEKLDLRISAQFTDQRSIGDELIGKFDTNSGAVQFAIGWAGAVVKLAASATNDNAGIRSPWGGKPGYLSIQRLDFDRANEKAFLIGLAYNTEFFSDLGLSSFINIAHGFDAEDPQTGDDLPDQTEYDLTIDYRPPKGPFEGLWIRFRCAWLDIEDGFDGIRDYRLTVNYEIPFL